MRKPNIGSDEDWLRARMALLEKEKAHSRARDELTRARQALPWVKVLTDYEFDGPDGKESLSDLFGGKSQLAIYHFMFDPEWDEGCKACSFVADHYERSVVHLEHRDVALVTVSKAPLSKIEPFKKRMGWTFKWVSSSQSDFNRDYRVSFTDEELATGVSYNFKENVEFPAREAPGISVFAKNDAGQVFHTYSAYARGLENFIGAYTLLDIVPKGRDEAGLSYGMEWLRHRDRYDD